MYSILVVAVLGTEDRPCGPHLVFLGGIRVPYLCRRLTCHSYVFGQGGQVR